ncbi:MAG: DUF4286 family protein [Vicingaceae bacterium]
MIIYNVTINVEEEVADNWLTYMKTRHIPDVLNTGCFSAHVISRLITRHEDETGITYAIQYHCPDMKTFERYEKEFAPALKQEVVDKYGGKFVAFRSLMETV